MYKQIRDKYGEEYMLRQLAEECNELAQAALKYIRAQRRETPMRVDEAVEHLVEEMADVRLMMEAVGYTVLTNDQEEAVYEIRDAKRARWEDRMINGNMDEEVW